METIAEWRRTAQQISSNLKWHRRVADDASNHIPIQKKVSLRVGTTVATKDKVPCMFRPLVIRTRERDLLGTRGDWTRSSVPRECNHVWWTVQTNTIYLTNHWLIIAPWVYVLGTFFFRKGAVVWGAIKHGLLSDDGRYCLLPTNESKKGARYLPAAPLAPTNKQNCCYQKML